MASLPSWLVLFPTGGFLFHNDDVYIKILIELKSYENLSSEHTKNVNQPKINE
jgi:hypothetical protein